MKTLQKAVDISKKVGEVVAITIGVVLFFVVIFFAGGGPAIFYVATECSGQQVVAVHSGDSPGSLARRYFGDEELNQGVVIESIQNLNGPKTFAGTGNAKIPMECHNSP